MSLGAITAGESAGAQPSAPTFIEHISVVGDDSYPTGGTLLFESLVQLALVDKRAVTLRGVSGLGFTAGAVTHFALYDKATDALQVFLLAGAEVGNAVDLSTTTFELTVIGD